MLFHDGDAFIYNELKRMFFHMELAYHPGVNIVFNGCQWQFETSQIINDVHENIQFAPECVSVINVKKYDGVRRK